MQFLSEPSGGSDVAGALTTAVRDGDAVGAQRLQGVDLGRVVVGLGPRAWPGPTGTQPKHRGLTVFMLPIHQPNVEVHRIEMLNGSREFCQEFMTDVVVPDTDRVGDGRRGLDRGHPLDVPRAHALQLALRDRARSGRPTAARTASIVYDIAREHGRLDDATARQNWSVRRACSNSWSRSWPSAVGEGIRSGRHVRSGGRLVPAVQGHAIGLADRHAGLRGRRRRRRGLDRGRQRVDRAPINFLMRQAGSIGGGTTEMARNVISERVLRHAAGAHAWTSDVPFRDVPAQPPRQPRSVSRRAPGTGARQRGANRAHRSDHQRTVARLRGDRGRGASPG